MAGDLYYDSNLLLVPGSGSSGSTTFVDKSPLPKTLVANGNVVTSNTKSRFNTGSMYFDGVGDWIAVTNTVDFYFNYSAFTIEAWVYINADSAPDAGGSRHGGIFGLNNPANTAVISLDIVGNTTTTGTGLLLEYKSGAAMTNRASSQAVSKGVWHHVAVCSDDKSVRFYLDGVGYATTPLAANIPYDATSIVSIGRANGFSTWERYFNGYINDLRVTRGVARYITDFTPSIDALPTYPYQPAGPIYSPGDVSYSSVVLLLHCDGADASTAFVDNSPTPKTVSAYGNASLSTTQSKFGGTAARFDGVGDYVVVANNAGFTFGSGDFTIEGWMYESVRGAIRQIAGNHTTYGPKAAEVGFLILSNNGMLGFSCYSGGSAFSATSTTATPLNTWVHFAAVRAGANLYLFQNGLLTASASIGASVVNTPSFPVTLGAVMTGIAGDNPDPGAYYFNGYLDEIRITKGVARYTAAFETPVAAFGNIQAEVTYPAEVAVSGDSRYAAVSLLLHGNGANGSLAFTDSSPAPKVVTGGGDTRISTAQSKFGGSSIYFDGIGDYLTIPSHSSFDFGLSDFTIELWVRPTAIGANQTLLSRYTAWATSAEFFTRIGTNGTIRVYLGNNVPLILTGTIPITANVWSHVAISRKSGTTRLFVNGALDVTSSISVSLSSTSPLGIGYELVGGLEYFSGYMDDIRITRAARYVDPFTPPTEAAPDILSRALKISGTVLDGSGYPALREVRVYRRDTGALLGNTFSNPTTGNYVYETPDLFEHTLVYLPGPTEKLNALIRDRVIPK